MSPLHDVLNDKRLKHKQDTELENPSAAKD